MGREIFIYWEAQTSSTIKGAISVESRLLAQVEVGTVVDDDDAMTHLALSLSIWRSSTTTCNERDRNKKHHHFLFSILSRPASFLAFG